MPYKSKEDQKAHDKEYREMHRDHILERDRKNGRKYYEEHKEIVCERVIKYGREHPSVNREAVKQYQKRNPQKINAQRMAQTRIPLVSKCELCGLQAEHRHHPDYTQPLVIMHVCQGCHRKLHRKEATP
jgi:hypothetical protein